MNKTAIKNFAVWARNKLIVDISYRAGLMGIAADGIRAALPQSTRDTEFYDIGTKEPYAITGGAVRQRRKLAELILQKAKSSDYETAYRSVLEEVAYTWFNRLIAIRFMEVNDYLPSRIRVLSSEGAGKLEPDLVTTPFDADLEMTGEEQETILRLKTDNQVDELFRLLFVKQCNALNQILPQLFEKTADYTELLLNVSVTDQDGVVYHLVHDIDEDDFNIEKGGQVEIIGWLYQYYNTEPKDETFALLKKNVKITKERIPAATQLFTPDWIVRYMVENSLGRLWLEGHPNEELRENWKYYLDEAKQEPEVEAQLAKIREEYKEIQPEDIKLIDPCMGSGHILVYAFDVLMQIYETAGYTQREAAKCVLEHNLYGLDIDDRAFQLSYFAVMMKARKYNRRILNGEAVCHVYSIQESNEINRNHLNYLGAGMNELERNNALNQLTGLLDTFKDAKEYGSILKVDACDWDLLRRFAAESGEDGQLTMDSLGLEETKEQLRQLIDIGQVMAQKYDVVVTNPPYMASSGMNSKLFNYIKRYYDDGRNDLYTVFILRCLEFARTNKYVGMITQLGWLSLARSEQLRHKIYTKMHIINMIHLGAHIFEELSGEIVKSSAFVLNKQCEIKYRGVYCKIDTLTSSEEKATAVIEKNNLYTATIEQTNEIEGAPLSYWLPRTMFPLFKNSTIRDRFTCRAGMQTGNNDEFIRLWYEPNSYKLNHFHKEGARWYLYNKGGSQRKWYGNIDLVVNWEENGRDIKAFKKRRFELGEIEKKNSECWNSEFYFVEGVTWSSISSGTPMFRFATCESIFDIKGPTCFAKEMVTHDELIQALAYFNSPIVSTLLEVMSPTLDCNPGTISKLPYIKALNGEVLNKFVYQCISLSKEDWDSFETSWDFKHHPLVRPVSTVSEAYATWAAECATRFNQLKSNEEELNRIFIDIYGLQDELTPEVADKDVTVRRFFDSKEDIPESMKGSSYALTKADAIKSLLSYAVGCMFGRYSLDVDGIAYAGGAWDKVNPGKAGREGGLGRDSKYQSFIPDKDNILPITDEEYFQDDIVGQFCGWLKKVYGADTLEENLDFIANALGNKGNTSREVIRNYFLNDFYKDHVKTYQKRPIYWLFDSGKQNGFKALIYMHRYDENTIGNLRIDYLHRMERVYDSEIARMQDIIDNSKAAREVSQAAKRREKLQKQLKECKAYDESVAHLALARTAIDLDDGVKVNYEKVQTVDGVKYPVLAKL